LERRELQAASLAHLVRTAVQRLRLPASQVNTKVANLTIPLIDHVEIEA